MNLPNNEDESLLLHHLAIYKQLSQLFPREVKYLRCQVEVLLQLQQHDKAETLLEKLQTLLQNDDLHEDAKQAAHLRSHINKTIHASQYYAVPFLHLASKRKLKNFFRIHRHIHIKEGEYLIRHGEKGDQMYIVLHGSLAVWSHDRHGQKHFEHTLQTGEIIGELAFLDGTERNADVIACQGSTLLAIPKQSVFKLFMDDPRIEETLRVEANTRKIQVAMKKNKALAKLPQHLQRMLAKGAFFIQHKALERIYTHDTKIISIDLVCDGYIRLIGELADGSSMVLNALKEGDLLGCTAITPHMESRYNADVACMSNVTLIRFPLSAFTDIVDLNPRFYQAILRQAEHERDCFLQTIAHQHSQKNPK